MKIFPGTVAGRAELAGARDPVVNPATEQVWCEVATADEPVLRRTLDAAAGAFPSWRRDEDARRRAVRQCGDLVRRRADELADLLTREQGKPLAAARAEVLLCADWFGHTADLVWDEAEVVRDGATEVTVRRRPHGVVAAITPWNYPLILAVCKAAPALLAGNTVVVKPSPFTPVSTLVMVQLLQEALPPGVLSAIAGGPQLGGQLVLSPLIGMVSLTGGVSTGRSVASTVAPTFRPVVLELGGNDPAVVLDDVDVATVAEPLFWGAFVNSGQFCAAVKRVYVHRSRYAGLVDSLVDLSREVRIGNGLHDGVDLGPLISRAQVDRVTALRDDAVSAGARAFPTAPVPDGPGYFLAPTIVGGLPDATALELEEQFGPVLPVIPFDDEEAAVRRANGSEYGLGASVWSGDVDRARRLGADLECGTLWVNTHGALRHDVPLAGVKSSGLGVEYGSWGLLEYLRPSVTHVVHPRSA